LSPPNWTKATETELRGRGWKGQGRKGREGMGIKEGEGEDEGRFTAKRWKGEGRKGRERTGGRFVARG